MRFALVMLLACLTWVASLAHVTAQPPPTVEPVNQNDAPAASVFLPRANNGVHHLVLHGPPYLRGRAEGSLTRHIFAREEKVLFSEFERFFPSPLFRAAFIVGAMRYFWGAEEYFPSHVREYLYGQAPYASPDYNHYIDPYTRQAVLHGIHEVGQLFVDVRREDLGCTAVIMPNAGSWMIGRNFDFEVGRLFDEEKTLKWQFPDHGYRYLSVSWPGFLGTVTGVNEHGIFISLNAAGSSDFRRYGQPTTLLATDILQFSANLDEAVERLTKAETFIADIFLLADQDRVLRVEKTPLRTRVIPVNGPHAITNHMEHPDLKDDPVNQWRMDQLTTRYRLARATELIERTNLDSLPTERSRELATLAILRDKDASGDKPLHIANRRAIDALIASHSVIYNAKAGRLYVSQGPALAGAFVGFDLPASFRLKTPVRLPSLPQDSRVGPEQFYQVKKALKDVAQAESLLAEQQCASAGQHLSKASAVIPQHNYYHRILGQYYACQNEPEKARQHWQQALNLRPAYKQDREYLEKRL